MATSTGHHVLGELRGRICDIDSHEQIPTSFWEREFGDVADIVLGLTNGILSMAAENSLARDDITADAMPIDDASVWRVKGPTAPSAIDMSRRPDVLDQMGIARQLIYPNFGMIGLQFVHNPLAPQSFGFDPAKFDHIDVGRRIIRAGNEWAARVVRQVGSDRLRPVAIIDTSDLDHMMVSAEAALAAGIRAVWIAGSVPPANTSPGNAVLDPFWRLMSDADVAVTLHIGTENALLASTQWAHGVPEFMPSSNSSLEFPVEPYRASTLHLTPSNFIAAMVLGGAFERHPGLRFGVIECAAHWIGPLGEQLDMWFDEFHSRLSPMLSMRPSDYLARNVRVTPFHFEPVDRYIEQYPGLSSVYCFSSDFPHREGGRDSAEVFAEKLQRLGGDVLKAFFVTNGSLLLPTISP